MVESEVKEVTTVEQSTPEHVVKTTKEVKPAVKTEPPQKVFEQKKTIFRFYQIIWYILGVIETLLVIRFVLRAFGANPFTGFVAFVYGITNPLTLPFQGIFGSSGNNSQYVIEWSTVVAIVVYALVAYGLVEVFQLVKPVSKEEVEQTVDEQT